MLAPIVNVLACVIVPVYPDTILIPATDPAKLASMVEFFVDVVLNVAMSDDVGQVSGPSQFAQVLQLLSPPPPSHVLVAASTSFPEESRNIEKIPIARSIFLLPEIDKASL